MTEAPEGTKLAGAYEFRMDPADTEAPSTLPRVLLGLVVLLVAGFVGARFVTQRRQAAPATAGGGSGPDGPDAGAPVDGGYPSGSDEGGSAAGSRQPAQRARVPPRSPWPTMTRPTPRGPPVDAPEEMSEAADSAEGAVGDVADEAQGQVSDMADQAEGEVGEAVDEAEGEVGEAGRRSRRRRGRGRGRC